MEDKGKKQKEKISRLSDRKSQWREKVGGLGIQATVLVSFTVVSVLFMLLKGFSLYQRFMM
ncbi:MAG: hypothetical protein J6D53_00715, partial [Blautia sp.]|nr:hypothetical protein [Blautia sp.]